MIGDGAEKHGEQKGMIIGGIILIIVGSYFLLSNAGILNIDFSMIWPFFLIIPGLFIIIVNLKKR